MTTVDPADRAAKWTDMITENARIVAVDQPRRWWWWLPLAGRRMMLENDALLAQNQQLLAALIATREPWKP